MNVGVSQACSYSAGRPGCHILIPAFFHLPTNVQVLALTLYTKDRNWNLVGLWDAKGRAVIEVQRRSHQSNKLTAQLTLFGYGVMSSATLVSCQWVELKGNERITKESQVKVWLNTCEHNGSSNSKFLLRILQPTMFWFHSPNFSLDGLKPDALRTLMLL